MIKYVENDTPNDTQTIPHTYNVYTLCICILDFGFSWGVPNDTPNDTQTIHQTIPSTHACHTIPHFRSARHPPLRTSMTSLLLSLLALACAGGQLCRCLCWRCWWLVLLWCLVSLLGCFGLVLGPAGLVLGVTGGGSAGGAPTPAAAAAAWSWCRCCCCCCLELVPLLLLLLLVLLLAVAEVVVVVLQLHCKAVAAKATPALPALMKMLIMNL